MMETRTISVRTIEAQIVQKLKNNEPQPKCTGSYKTKPACIMCCYCWHFEACRDVSVVGVFTRGAELLRAPPTPSSPFSGLGLTLVSIITPNFGPQPRVFLKMFLFLGCAYILKLLFPI